MISLIDGFAVHVDNQIGFIIRICIIFSLYDPIKLWIFHGCICVCLCVCFFHQCINSLMNIYRSCIYILNDGRYMDRGKRKDSLSEKILDPPGHNDIASNFLSVTEINSVVSLNRQSSHQKVTRTQPNKKLVCLLSST